MLQFSIMYQADSNDFPKYVSSNKGKNKIQLTVYSRCNKREQ